jgi:ribosomal protein S27AE
MDPITKRFIQAQLMWVGISLAISIAISLLLPFPYDLITIIVIFIGINYFVRKRQTKQINSNGSSFIFAAHNTVQYYCMNCGVKHNEAICPKCGSKLRKAGFSA